MDDLFYDLSSSEQLRILGVDSPEMEAVMAEDDERRFAEENPVRYQAMKDLQKAENDIREAEIALADAYKRRYEAGVKAGLWEESVCPF